MRVSIREQLGLLVLLTSLVALAVIAIATWVNNYNFIVGIRESRLELTASLKAAQLSANLVLLQSIAESAASSIVIQSALQRYITDRNNSASNWSRAQQDLVPTLGVGGVQLLQTVVFAPNASGPGGPYGLLNVTGDTVGGIKLPYNNPNGSAVMLGDPGLGYPDQWYPNITYSSTSEGRGRNRSLANIDGVTIGDPGSAVLLGPFQLNASFAVMTLTLPVINNTSSVDTLGFMAFLLSAQPLYDVVNSPVGLDNTGECLIVGPASTTNRFFNNAAFQGAIAPKNSTPPEEYLVHYVLPPPQNTTRGNRHPKSALGNSPAFPMKQFPAVFDGFTKNTGEINNAGTLIDTTNEEGGKVSVSYAIPATPFADWLLLVEADKAEAFAPIVHLRRILLACVFGTAGAILLAVFPLAHAFVRPIRRLREATKQTVEPLGRAEERDSSPSTSSDGEEALSPGDEENQGSDLKKGSLAMLRRWRTRRHAALKSPSSGRSPHRTFRIPGKVVDRKHYVADELTDLTKTYNAMSDELTMQYERLEEKVIERTRELERSKKAAEAANESKTLFIANISHELKTPLNGILGMCAVCMGEEDLTKIKRSLGIIYKSGDLLLHLLTDLLTFSRNQIGQQLSLEEREFRLIDISSQILNIFEKQAKEGNITLKATFSGPDSGFIEKGYGPMGTGRVKDMCLWGDQNRILQVIINLVSNSLKFTPPGQTVEVRIKCVGEAEIEESNRKSSLNSRQSKQSSAKHRQRHRGSDTASSEISPAGARVREDGPPKLDTALSINPIEEKTLPHIFVREQSQSPAPAPANIRYLMFEFEVQDTGPGIPEHLQERVFEPFMQGDLGLSKKYGGTGLGLSICQQLAKLMQGTMTLKSQVGQGSTFTMRIPLIFTKERADSLSSSRVQSGRNSVTTNSNAEEGAAPNAKVVGNDSSTNLSFDSAHSNTGRDKVDTQTPTKPRLVGLSQPFFVPNPSPESPKSQIAAMEAAATEATKMGQKVRVLVAEDNKVNQEVVMRMLKLEDIYDIHVAKDGQEAYDMVKQSMEQKKLYNLVFMDIQMPNVDGLQSTRLIREMGFSAPIVALTAFAEESNVKECMDSGMNYFLSKPIKRPALKQVLKTYCTTIPEESEPLTLDDETDGLPPP